jgi:hypothetical protein
VTVSTLTRLLCLGGLGLTASSAVAQEIYCWKDDAGQTVCGDSVPPDQSRFDRNVRNEQGIILRFEEGEITPEEQAAIVERLRLEAEEKAAREESERYDRVLLDSYERVEDIEARRDRFLAQFQGEIIVTELYLGNLGNKLEQLMERANRYAPYSENPDADQIPENLALDIQRTQSSITRFTRRLEEIHVEQQRTREQFDKDIVRFRELKGIDNA